jgi:hypothetical protein
MLIGTHHGTVVAVRDAPLIAHVAADRLEKPLRVGGPRQLARFVAAHWNGAACDGGAEGFHVVRDGRYLRADPDGELRLDSGTRGEWETFRLVAEEDRAIGFDDAALAEVRRFAAKARALRAAGRPVKIQFGALWAAIPGFLNVDLGFYHPQFIAERPDEYFAFPYVGVRLPLDGGIADYIYHEDFIEHLDQLGQLQFLAEARRLLAPGGIHRVNTPSLEWAMAAFSDVSRGAAGVYTGEQRWGHIALMTRRSLDEMARMAGYSDVVFNGRDRGLSPHADRETRPFADRDAEQGNLFADLIR